VNLYQTLEIAETAAAAEIKDAYRRQAMKWQNSASSFF
jgi:DnaJ-class molecular chaperone